MKFAVFISAGIGNAIFLIPLIKALRNKGKVTAIYTSSFKSERVFDGFEENFFDSHIDMRGNGNLTRAILFNLGTFDGVYMDYFSSTRKSIIASYFMASEINCFKIPAQLPNWYKKKIKLQKLEIGAHEGLQNLSLFDPVSSDTITYEHFRSTPKRNHQADYGDYITIQPGAGNNQTPWKIWDSNNWFTLLNLIGAEFPKLNIVILGDQYDNHVGHYLSSANAKTISLIDQTMIEELPSILDESQLHIGGDSGLLHIAGSVGTKTLTIVGGSDPDVFGWHKISPANHKIVQHKLYCHPCYRHYLPNQSRTTSPSKCPDFKCISGITVEEVFQMFTKLMTTPLD